MCNLTHHTEDDFCFIVPPHMLEVLFARGDAEMRASIKEMKIAHEDIRNFREEADLQPQKRKAALIGQIANFAPPPTGSPTHTLNRQIHDAKNGASLPGNPARSEGAPPTNDPIVNAAYDGAGDVYEMYFQAFNRDSIDNNAMPLTSTVHYRNNFNNAFWNGFQMVYGDGDGRIFDTMVDLSVIGHEMSHGVVQHAGGLIYKDQSGALNESFADVFGALTVQFTRQEAAHEANWLIGENILASGINGKALRDMKAPGTAYSDPLLGQDPQPYHMDFFVVTSSDKGGVHINSGIPNHAFYLYSQYIGGNAWEIPGNIWYQTLHTINNPLATFQDWAEQTLITAIDIHGNGSRESLMLRRAWKLVGISI